MANFRYSKQATGETALVVFSSWDHESLSEAARGEFDRLFLDRGTWGDFTELLNMSSDIRKLTVRGNCDSFLGIQELKNLEALSVDVQSKEKLSLACLGNLRRLYIHDFSVCDGDFSALSSCEVLSISKFNQRDLSSLSYLSTLSVLELRRSKLECLKGIGELPSLVELELEYLNKLEHIDALSDSRRIEVLRIQSCNRIEDFTPIAALTSLKHLGILNKEIPSLSFLAGLPKLERITFGDTKVVDGDLSILMELQALKYVNFQNKRHYSHRTSDFLQG